MKKRGHVLNALLLSVGIGYLLEPAGDVATFEAISKVSVPMVLGALFPDVDTAFGPHRKACHNLFVLGAIVAYPVYFGNLQYVWIGVLSHFALDLLGTRRGLAPLYPLVDREVDLPIGVRVDSRYATAMLLAVTALELVVAAAIIYRVPQRVARDELGLVGLF